MGNRGHSFIVEVVGKRKPNADYASKPGDARRSGRANNVAGLLPVHIDFHERAQSIEARIGVVTVGVVTHDVASKGYFWAVDLPGLPKAPRPARDADAAQRAIIRKIGEWCEAAELISARRRGRR
ncbi:MULTISPECIES: hypothetical protein [unclassified Bradyrhizobium]|uniref:hypothetical protein n=1 Tax=unclassified Bradyrhizobium TaxID=2631580 RepID=UPI0029165C48|nr:MULTISPECIES: hypothetical protein [unclassified Bradyrhizobium]